MLKFVTFYTVTEFVLVFKLKAVATLLDGTLVEEELQIPVIDKNDNSPVFSFTVSQTTGAVNESSAAGIPVTDIKNSVTLYYHTFN